MSALRCGFQHNHETAFSRISHRPQDEFTIFPKKPKSKGLVQEIPRYNQFSKTNQTDIDYRKLPVSSIWLEPNLSIEARRSS